MAIMKGRKANGDLGEVALTNDGEMKTDLNVDSEGLATAAKQDTIIANQGVHKSVNTIIDDATFSATVESEDIDFSEYKHAILTIKTGAVTDAPTLTAKLQIKDSNGNYHDYTTLSAVSTETTITPEELYFLSASTVRVVCTYGGSGSFASVTVELTLMD